MTPFGLLAASLKGRGVYEAIVASGEAEVLPEELVPIWQSIEKFYQCDDNAAAADPEIVTAYACETVVNPKHREQIAKQVSLLAASEISATNVQEMLRLVARTRVQDKLAQALAQRKPQEEVDPLIAEYRELCTPISAETEAMDWANIVTHRLDPSARLPIAPKSLTEFLGGGPLPGHNIIVYARPEAGKTALALSIAVSSARKGRRVLYFINEDPVQDLAVRAMTNILNCTSAQILEDPVTATQTALKKGLGNLVLREGTPGSVRELEALVRQHKPDVLIVDQMRNLRVAKTDNYTQGLDHIAQGIRAITKRYNIIGVSTTQAGDSARNKAVLDDGDIDSSNTGIPGAADVLIGMGVNDTLRSAGQRILSVCKNKASGQHGYFTVNINPQTSKVTS